MQAVKYAAMASRFSAALLAEYHAAFLAPRGTTITEAEALAKLQTHVDVGLLADQLINPRIVLLAESFPPSVTATAVWLNEQGVDLTLMRYQAYRTGPLQIVLTVSQLYPVREVAEFEIAPHTSFKVPKSPDLPEVPWTPEDLAQLAPLANATTAAILDLCAEQPDTWIGVSGAYARAGVNTASGSGQLGGFGLTVRAKFGRRNPPYQREWAQGGVNQAYYRMDADLAAAWRNLRAVDGPEPSPGAPPLADPGSGPLVAPSSVVRDRDEVIG
jgi:hypothetical protein